MGQTYKADFQVDNGTDYDKYNFSTSADQVSYTKNGKETNVQAELDAVNTHLLKYTEFTVDLTENPYVSPFKSFGQISTGLSIKSMVIETTGNTTPCIATKSGGNVFLYATAPITVTVLIGYA